MGVKILGLFKVTVSKFFGETNLESSFQHQMQQRRNKLKKDLSRSKVTAGDPS